MGEESEAKISKRERKKQTGSTQVKRSHEEKRPNPNPPLFYAITTPGKGKDLKSDSEKHIYGGANANYAKQVSHLAWPDSRAPDADLSGAQSGCNPGQQASWWDVTL